jgi:maltose/moltooligosaccharide transporter
MEKPQRSYWQISNLSFGFLGIQFGWGLQMANMSAIYEYLGANAAQIPILWLAAPLTGLLVQPLVGQASDRTWGRFGRRRPYILFGAILSSLALLLMPRSASLWMAAGLLWILDGSVNVSMQPFRSLVSDLLPERQLNLGYAFQSLFVGLGNVLSSAMPLLLTSVFGLREAAGSGYAIPLAVRLSFYIGAVAFLGAVLWSFFTTHENPPEDMAAFLAAKREHKGLWRNLCEIGGQLRTMPRTMRQLAPVQLLTWTGLYAMWLYFPVAVAHNVFGAASEKSPVYTAGVEWAGLCFGMYSAVCFVFSFILPAITNRLGRRWTHSLCLLAGALGLLSVGLIHDRWLLLLSMTGVGIAWTSILSIPFAMLSTSLPKEHVGVYMGIFNLFIVIPEIVASLCFGWIMSHLLHNDRMLAVILGGALMLCAALLMPTVRETHATE